MNLFERVKGILLNPRAEWAIIEREPGDMAYLFMNYVAILAAIPAICGFIGSSLIGISLPGLGTIRVPIVTGLVGAVVGYLLTFAMVYIVALLADLLAPTFQGQKNFESALKLVVYSYTPAWLVGVFLLIPSLGFLTILGLYGLYLLWTGIPPLMKAPQEKSIVYTLAIIVCAIVIGLIVGLVQAAIMPFPRA
jgi:hypothetical protein